MSHLLVIFGTLVIAGVLSYILLFARPAAEAAEGVEENYFQHLLEPADMRAFSGEGEGYRWSQTGGEVEVLKQHGPSTAHPHTDPAASVRQLRCWPHAIVPIPSLIPTPQPTDRHR